MRDEYVYIYLSVIRVCYLHIVTVLSVILIHYSLVSNVVLRMIYYD